MKSLVINKEDLKHNIRQIKNYSKNAKVIAVVKSNGYGMDLIKYTEFLIDNGIEIFAVATIEEAIWLREAGIKNEIIMLSSTSIEEDVELLINNNITITIGSELSGKIANDIAKKNNKKVKAHIKVDTGFGRYGIPYSKKEEILNIIKENKNIDFDGIYSHFSISFYDDKVTKEQYNRFIEVIEYLEKNDIKIKLKHICNSSSFIKFPEMHLSAVRVGSAFTGRILVANKLGLKKIGYLESRVAEIRKLPSNFNVGYSNIYKTKEDTKVAIVPVGDSDGFNLISDKDMFRKVDKLRYTINDIKSFFKKQSLKVKINDKIYNVIGRIGMYHCTIYIKNDDVNIGDRAKFNVNPLYVDTRIRREYR